jgi:hypothetical protein
MPAMAWSGDESGEDDAGRAVRRHVRGQSRRDVGVLVELAQADGWDVCCILTPSARIFVDAMALVVLTAHPGAHPRIKPL